MTSLLTATSITERDLDRYDVVSFMDSGAILLADKTKKLGKPNFSELGSTGMTAFGAAAREEYNPTLSGQQGRAVYNKMRRSDGQVRGTLRLVKTPVLAARWYVAPFSDKRSDQKIAEFVEAALMKRMTTSFPQFLTEVLTMLDFGFSAFELVWALQEYKGKQMVMLQKLGMRHALDVQKFEYDPKGGPAGVVVNDQNAASGEVFIPIDKLVVFTHDREGGDMEGVSVLRSAYKHWFYKEQLYKVDAIQKERHGIGIPVIKLPQGYTPADKLSAEEMGRNLRTNEKAHIVLPPGWEIMMLKLEGQPTKAMESIEHHDLLISRNILGQFINAEFANNSQESMQTLFLKSTRYIAELVRDAINKYLIPKLVGYNFPKVVEEMPELRVRRIGDTMDWRTVSFAVRNFIGSGVIIPDDRMEDWIRDEMDLPPVEEATRRIIIQPLAEGEIPDGQPDTMPGAGDESTLATRQNKGAGSQATPPKPNSPGTRQTKTGPQGPGNNGRVGRDGSNS